MHLRLVQGFARIGLDAITEDPKRPFVRLVQGPRAQQRLIEQILLVAIRSRLPLDVGLVFFIELVPELKMAFPEFRNFGQDIDPGPNVLTAFRIMGRSRGKCVRPGHLAFPHDPVKGTHADPELFRIPTDLVQ